MAIKPRLNPPHVLAGDAPGGAAQIVFTQLLIVGTIVVTYIGLWLYLDDSSRLPGTKVQPPKQIAMPYYYRHEVPWTKELTDVRASEQQKLTVAGAIAGASDAAAYRIPIENAMALVVQRGLPTKLMPEAMRQLDVRRESTEANGGQAEWLHNPEREALGGVSHAADGAAPAATGSEAHSATAPAVAAHGVAGYDQAKHAAGGSDIGHSAAPAASTASPAGGH
ncbi:MAG: hypothetical protein H7338_23280 [Candidatus Sericytochromatia bacterium]|nr:hypothetical protein [Candidatus Sericytochromatia bacterium]